MHALRWIGLFTVVTMAACAGHNTASPPSAAVSLTTTVQDADVFPVAVRWMASQYRVNLQVDPRPKFPSEKAAALVSTTSRASIESRRRASLRELKIPALVNDTLLDHCSAIQVATASADQDRSLRRGCPTSRMAHAQFDLPHTPPRPRPVGTTTPQGGVDTTHVVASVLDIGPRGYTIVTHELSLLHDGKRWRVVSAKLISTVE